MFFGIKNQDAAAKAPAPTPSATPTPAAMAAEPTPTPAATPTPDHDEALKALETEANDLLRRIAAEVDNAGGLLTRELALAKTKLREFVELVEAHFKKIAAK